MKPFYRDKAVIAITSGTLITFDRYQQIGPFDESYFIDFIDNEYCLRAYKLGLKVAVNCRALINHSIGKREKKHIFKIEMKPNNHNAKRRYFIARNGIRTAVLYFSQFKLYLLLVVLRLLHEIISIALYENNKFFKLRAVVVGIFDGCLGKMGIARSIFSDPITKKR